MASLPEQHTSYLTEGNVSSLPVKTKCIGVKIDGAHTDIVLNEYSNRVFIILSQYRKLGTLITVEKETSRNTNGCSEVYQIRTILGGEDPSYHIAARYLTEETQIVKPALFSISMKNCDLPTLKIIRDIIVQNKSW